MEKEILTKEIFKIIESSFFIKPGTLTIETRLETITKDSMDFIELLAILSSTYQLTVQSSDLNKIETVADIIDFVSLTKSKPSTSDIKLHKF